MTIQEYLDLYGKEMRESTRNYAVNLASPMGWPGAVHLDSGVLQFSAETAACWGGPFEGGYAVYRLTNHSATMAGQPATRHRPSTLKPYCRLGDLQAGASERQEYPSTARPIELKMWGNDDTSYTKYYATAVEAREDLALFQASQPLDFHEVVEGFEFIFTN
jgi:hypothetical protein